MGQVILSSKSKAVVTHGMLPFTRRGADRVIPLEKRITVRQLFHHKRFRSLREKFVLFAGRSKGENWGWSSQREFELKAVHTQPDIA